MIKESIEYHIYGIPTSYLMTWLVWIILGGISIMVARRARLVPSKIQLTFEIALDYVTSLADELVGPEAYKFYPLFVGLFLYILVSNLIGLVPGLNSPTADPAVAFGLALMVFVYFIFIGVRYHGLKYFKQFLGVPLPWYLFPISVLLAFTEIISLFTRPLSLGLRLFCNIFSKELFLLILASLFLNFFNSKLPVEHYGGSFVLILVRLFIMVLGLIIAFIQALVFMVLSMSYIAGAVKIEEHH